MSVNTMSETLLASSTIVVAGKMRINATWFAQKNGFYRRNLLASFPHLVLVGAKGLEASIDIIWPRQDSRNLGFIKRLDLCMRPNVVVIVVVLMTERIMHPRHGRKHSLESPGLTESCAGVLDLGSVLVDSKVRNNMRNLSFLNALRLVAAWVVV